MQEKALTSMHSVGLEPAKLILIGTRTTNEATGDAGNMIQYYDVTKYLHRTVHIEHMPEYPARTAPAFLGTTHTWKYSYTTIVWKHYYRLTESF